MSKNSLKTRLNPEITTEGELKKYVGLSWSNQAKVHILQGPFALLHGGLSDQLDTREHILKTLTSMGRKVQKVLKKRALDICLKGVEELESDATFNAGYGAKMQYDGIARLSSAVMDGADQRMAAVSNIVGIKHPSQFAAQLLDENDRTLCGAEATRVAYSRGISPQHLETEKRYLEWKSKREAFFGTVGCVALDADRSTAASTSTGGRGFETPGRVSDSCTPAGNFANPFGAVSCTGVGEQILEASVASAICIRLEDGVVLEESVNRVFNRHSEKSFGMIALDRSGRACVHATRGSLAYVLVTERGVYPGLLPSDWRDTTIV